MILSYLPNSLPPKLDGSQTRKYNNKPYITHPIAVMKRLKQFTNDSNVLAAALLHDVVEDTSITIDEIRAEFGDIVANLVAELTSDKQKSKQMGKDKYLTEKINRMTSEARLIKFADRENNVSDLTHDDAEFSSRYAHETEYILDHLTFLPTPTEQKLINAIRKKIEMYVNK